MEGEGTTFLDLDALLKPVSEESPSGENLEYDPAFQDLERISAGKAGTYDPISQNTVGAEEPDWHRVRTLALELFARTRDLRVAFHLMRALLLQHGLPGLSSGLALIAGLTDRFWPSLYPRLIEDEDNDPVERINALANLVDTDRFLHFLSTTTIVEARGVGRFTIRDLDLAQDRVAARKDEAVASMSMLQGAWQEASPEENAARQAAIEDALAFLKQIEARFNEHTHTAPDFTALFRMLQTVRAFYSDMLGGQVGSESSGAAELGAVVASGTGGSAIGGLTSRTDAVRVLRQVSDFLKRTEPSSPAPMLIDRAVKLLEMDFADIVRELMPDARDRIELIGGIKFEETDN